MKSILLTGFSPSNTIVKYMNEKGYEILAPGHISEEEIQKYIKNVDAYIPGGEEKVTDRIINAGNRLKVISYCGVGYDYYVDVKAAIRNNIAVTYVPNANSLAVAEFTASLICTLLKKIILLNENTKSLSWDKMELDDISNKKIGIVGMGGVGCLVAKIFHNGFGSDILYYSRSRKKEIERNYNAKFLSLTKLCKDADIITLHLPYTLDTNNILGKECFKCIKKNAIIINTSRAELVDPIELRNALLNDVVKVAAFDCYYGGKIPKDVEADKWGLLSLPNEKFIITPHVAYNTQSSNARVEKITFENIIDIIERGVCINQVA